MPHVHRISRFGFVNAYLVEEEDGLTLVDTLIAGSAKTVLAAAQALGKPIVRIAITHAHTDHIGSLDALKQQLPGAEVAIGTREAKLMAGDLTPESGETAKPRSFNFPKAKTVPDRLVAPGDRVGSLEVHAAPGHSPGQVAYLDTRDRTLYCGDALHTFGGDIHVTDKGTLRFPAPGLVIFDKAAAQQTARELTALTPARVAPGHGKVIEQPGAKLERALSAMG